MLLWLRALLSRLTDSVALRNAPLFENAYSSGSRHHFFMNSIGTRNTENEEQKTPDAHFESTIIQQWANNNPFDAPPSALVF